MSLATRLARSNNNAVDPFTHDFNDVVSQFFNSAVPGVAGQIARYAIDVRENDDTLIFEVDLPGFKKEDIDITLENQTLTLSANQAGVHTAEQPADDKAETRYLLRERRRSSFSRSFQLPQTIDGSNVEATLTDGVLTMTLRKREDTKPRKITVS